MAATGHYRFWYWHDFRTKKEKVYVKNYYVRTSKRVLVTKGCKGRDDEYKWREIDMKGFYIKYDRGRLIELFNKHPKSYVFALHFYSSTEAERAHRKLMEMWYPRRHMTGPAHRFRRETATSSSSSSSFEPSNESSGSGSNSDCRVITVKSKSNRRLRGCQSAHCMPVQSRWTCGCSHPMEAHEHDHNLITSIPSSCNHTNRVPGTNPATVNQTTQAATATTSSMPMPDEGTGNGTQGEANVESTDIKSSVSPPDSQDAAHTDQVPQDQIPNPLFQPKAAVKAERKSSTSTFNPFINISELKVPNPPIYLNVTRNALGRMTRGVDILTEVEKVHDQTLANLDKMTFVYCVNTATIKSDSSVLNLSFSSQSQDTQEDPPDQQ